MKSINGALLMKRKSKTPNCGACGPTAMPIKIRNGTLDKRSFDASHTANVINVKARPTSRTACSISINLACHKELFQFGNRAAIAGEDERCSFVEHGAGLGINSF